MDLIEKAARAIADTSPEGGGSVRAIFRGVSDAAGLDWSEKSFQDSMAFLARAVIEAIREPSEAMVDAIGLAQPSPSLRQQAVDDWKAMINQILSEQK